jgi:hypothetical protein
LRAAWHALLHGQQPGQDGHGVRGGADADPPVRAGLSPPGHAACRVGGVGQPTRGRGGLPRRHPLDPGGDQLLVDTAAQLGGQVPGLADDQPGHVLADLTLGQEPGEAGELGGQGTGDAQPA